MLLGTSLIQTCCSCILHHLVYQATCLSFISLFFPSMGLRSGHSDLSWDGQLLTCTKFYSFAKTTNSEAENWGPFSVSGTPCNVILCRLPWELSSWESISCHQILAWDIHDPIGVWISVCKEVGHPALLCPGVKSKACGLFWSQSPTLAGKSGNAHRPM